MTKFMTKVTLTTTLLAVAMSSSVMAKPGKGDKGCHAQIFSQLNLSAQQEADFAAIKAEREANKEANKEANEAQRKANREAMEAIVLADTYDETKAKALVDEGATAKLAGIKSKYDMMSILTTEQKAKLQELKDDCKSNKDDKKDGKKFGKRGERQEK